MQRSIGARPIPRLLALFLVVTLLPAAALAWLGWRLLEQDRQLEGQRVQDLVESTANSVTAALERELGAIERNLGSLVAATEDPAKSHSAVAVRVDRSGVVSVAAGPRLIYEPAGMPASSEPADSVWAEAERLEFAARDTSAAVRAYRSLALSQDPNVRAGALVRLARVLKLSGRADEALDTYSVLAAIPTATMLGDPADLMARLARVQLLHALDRGDAMRTEAASLESDFRSGRWRLDRTTALTYAKALRPWRTDSDQVAIEARIRLTDAVATLLRGCQRRGHSRE